MVTQRAGGVDCPAPASTRLLLRAESGRALGLLIGSGYEVRQPGDLRVEADIAGLTEQVRSQHRILALIQRARGKTAGGDTTGTCLLEVSERLSGVRLYSQACLVTLAEAATAARPSAIAGLAEEGCAADIIAWHSGTTVVERSQHEAALAIATKTRVSEDGRSFLTHQRDQACARA